MSVQPLRAGVVGLGVGKNHAAAYAANPHVKLAALCDSNEIRLNALADEHHIPVEGRFNDYKQMLAEADLDLVSVCLPNVLHASASIDALNAGAHVLCEKPMALTVAEAESMIEASLQNGCQLAVAYNYRYRPDSQWMYRIVQCGQLGDIYHANISWRRETGIPGWGGFNSKQMSGGGALIDLGVHVLDLALWMLGFPDVRTVSGDTRMVFGPDSMKTWGRRPGQPVEGGFDVEDGAVGFIRLANNANMVVQVTWAEHAQPQDDRIRVELQGDKGSAVLNIANYKKEDTLRMYTEIEGEPVTVIPEVRWLSPHGHAGLINDVVDSLLHNRPVPVDGWQGLAAVRVLDAIYESSNTGLEVILDIPTVKIGNLRKFGS